MVMAKQGSGWQYLKMNNILETLRHKPWITQFLRYVMVGLFSNLAAYLVYLYITHLGVAPKLAMTLLYTTSVVISFAGNRQLSFSYKGGISTAALRFIAAHICGYFLNLSILIVFADMMGYPYQIVQAVAMIVVALFLFVIFRYFVFYNKPVADKDAP